MRISYLAIVAGAFAMAGGANAATIVNGDVTASLTGDFFVDDAVTGGGDNTTQESGTNPRTIGPRFWDLDSSGTIDAGDLVAGTVTVTGFGFASSGTATANDATSVTLEFLYLGLDGLVGGGDDVSLGSETVGYNHTGAGEYFVNFETSLSASIDGANNKFATILTVNDTDGGLDESLRIKTNPLQFESFSGPKLSVTGSFTPVPEPGSFAFLCIGGLALLRRREKV